MYPSSVTPSKRCGASAASLVSGSSGGPSPCPQDLTVPQEVLLCPILSHATCKIPNPEHLLGADTEGSVGTNMGIIDGFN